MARWRDLRRRGCRFLTALRGRLGTTAVAALVVLVLPGDAGAKVTCQQRGVEGGGVEVSGLPAAPVAAHRYVLTVTAGTEDAIREVPQLVVLSCPDAGADDYEWLRAAPTDDSRTFTIDVRFPEAGRYAMSVFDLSGQFRDAGLHDVVTAAAEEPASTSAGAPPSSGTPGSLWIGGAAALAAVVAASSVAVRRRRSP